MGVKQGSVLIGDVRKINMAVKKKSGAGELTSKTPQAMYGLRQDALLSINKP
jgi:hypothetical protein